MFVPTIHFVLLHGRRLLFGIESSDALPVLLFNNVAALTLFGFNVVAVSGTKIAAGLDYADCLNIHKNRTQYAGHRGQVRFGA
jgi:hypothetical protein